VAEAFADVYKLALQDDSKSMSILSFLFGSYDWDRGKDLRVAVIDTFMGSRWAPGDLAIAADRADILRKIFKRVHRKRDGDAYISAMINDLTQRNEAQASQTAAKLRKLVDDPNFYEEWD
jgi:hypothetical protein